MIKAAFLVLGILTCNLLSAQFSCAGFTTTNVAYTGSPQSFVVPVGVTQVRISITGASGGIATGSANDAGGGATVYTYIDVVPGDVFRILIGQKGTNGDFEAGGGGSSAVYKNGTLIMVAGGGGGEDNTGNGGNGLTTIDGGSSTGDNAGTSPCVFSPNNGLGGTGGSGGNHGEFAASCLHGGGGGGGLNSAGMGNGNINAGQPGSAANINGAMGGVAAADDGAGVNGGWGWSGGGGADDRESGGGGGYSGGGGGPESFAPGGGGSFLAAIGNNGITFSGSSAGVGTTTGADGSGTICSIVPITLPVSLLAFTADQSTAGTILKWTTDTEINASSYIIEKSTNGTQFTAIGQVPASNTSGTQYYSFTDAAAIVTKAYYRLKMVDIDGRYSYSAVRFIDVRELVTMLVYPNPAVNNVTVTLPDAWRRSATRIQVLDMKGRMVIEKMATALQNDIDVSALQTGLYMVRAVNEKFSTPLTGRFSK
jgi:hypothetical protein